MFAKDRLLRMRYARAGASYGELGWDEEQIDLTRTQRSKDDNARRFRLFTTLRVRYFCPQR